MTPSQAVTIVMQSLREDPGDCILCASKPPTTLMIGAANFVGKNAELLGAKPGGQVIAGYAVCEDCARSRTPDQLTADIDATLHKKLNLDPPTSMPDLVLRSVPREQKT